MIRLIKINMAIDKKIIALVLLVVMLGGIGVWYAGTMKQVLTDFYTTREMVSKAMQNFADFANIVLTLEAKVNFLEEKVAGLEALSLPAVPAPPRP